MIRHMARNRDAGKDFIRGSLILKCMEIEPASKSASPEAAANLNAGYHMAAINMIARITFSVPTT